MNGPQQERHNIHWFPGHMTKTLRNIDKRLPLVDAVVQLLDARIPYSSLNPDLQKAYLHKPRLYILNKADLADESVSREWLDYFKSEESGCIAINSKQKGSAVKARGIIDEALAELLAKRKERGISGAKIRLMVTGIPNVGKSTFINNWAGNVIAKASDKPGVTRGEQWINAGKYELLDMPGVLWKKFENHKIAVNLALIGSIPDRLLDVEDIASVLLQQGATAFPGTLMERYKIKQEQLDQLDGWHLLEEVGRKRGMLMPGGVIDTERAAIMLLDEFRGGKLGRITLEKPN